MCVATERCRLLAGALGILGHTAFMVFCTTEAIDRKYGVIILDRTFTSQLVDLAESPDVYNDRLLSPGIAAPNKI